MHFGTNGFPTGGSEKTSQFGNVILEQLPHYAKRPFLRAVKEEAKKVVVVSRLPKNAALFGLPKEPPPGRRGRKPIYGKERIKLRLRAGQTRGWQEVACVQYNKPVTKTIKTFLATGRPAGGVIRVVLVKEDDRWLPYFSTEPTATVEDVLEGMAGPGAASTSHGLFSRAKGPVSRSGWARLRLWEKLPALPAVVPSFRQFRRRSPTSSLGGNAKPQTAARRGSPLAAWRSFSRSDFFPISHEPPCCRGVYQWYGDAGRKRQRPVTEAPFSRK